MQYKIEVSGGEMATMIACCSAISQMVRQGEFRFSPKLIAGTIERGVPPPFTEPEMIRAVAQRLADLASAADIAAAKPGA